MAQHQQMPATEDDPEFRDSVTEVAGAVNYAIGCAEQLAAHGIVESMSFDRLMETLAEAKAVLEAIRAKHSPTPTTIFPSRAVAEMYVTKYPLPADSQYEIRADGAGRCVIAVLRISAYV